MWVYSNSMYCLLNFSVYIKLLKNKVTPEQRYTGVLMFHIIYHQRNAKETIDTTIHLFSSVQFSHSAVSELCDPMNSSTPGLPVHQQFPEFTQTHVHRVGDAIQLSHPLSPPSPPAPSPSQHQGLFKWVDSSHEVAKVLEFQLQHQSFQWTPRTDLL